MSTLTQHLNCFSKLSTLTWWNSSIRGAVNQGNASKALALFHQLKLNGLQPNNFTFPFLSKACAKLSHLTNSQIIHTHVVKSPFYSDIYVQTAMVDMYVKCGKVDDAYNLFDKMPVRNIASWNAMIIGFSQIGSLDRVFNLFMGMRLVGTRPDAATVIGLTRAVISAKSLRFLKAVHAIGIETGLDADTSVSNTWIAAYSKCGELQLAKMVFHGIQKTARSSVSWNSLIACYAHFGKYVDAVKSYKGLLCDGFKPDASTIISLLSSCQQPEALIYGFLIHGHGFQLGCDSDISLINTLISMYSRCGDISSATILFDGMSIRTCVSWTAMISGYSEVGRVDDALVLFNAMEETGEKPDIVTVLSLISGCGKTGALGLGHWIDNYASLHELKKDVVVCNALIDMYAKCGSLNDAREIFYSLPNRTVVSWTAMIAACALNGEFREALDLFSLLSESGIEPNNITFLAVLQACCHGGYLEKGRECFMMMTERYGINPGLDHYSCMIDLLGRKGKLIEALEVIQDMPMKPDEGIWGALLGACKIHNNMEIGEYVSRYLFELQPRVAVSFVEMANIYASVGRWDEVAAMRKTMRSNQMRKSPGKSVVQVNGMSHVFFVEDRSHHDSLLIYEALGNLAMQMKQKEFSSHAQRWVELDTI
ncbi:pentatricopeptide repeat-containing protein At4g19191, mitochondrial [Cucumis sativus]|uniref:Pentatricopeptide repeat-containing protein n=1 Tax=Cucumis sativus TaxID=3659 RepID=A0A0A0KK94_CUCSA|nr:pentatricopeptide repeat-containing protein At4g19191, mitochondrial [Cucumis sativus]XP_031743718.1 pentatricopeptide repeat-containing protein At4g19191, mitochondrial [Cucumis sativus]XP_031743719.1 pentatricopeptide repeat-containing protein At4g19191, mitochondrial [Cucumis sativus]